MNWSVIRFTQISVVWQEFCKSMCLLLINQNLQKGIVSQKTAVSWLVASFRFRVVLSCGSRWWYASICMYYHVAI